MVRIKNPDHGAARQKKKKIYGLIFFSESPYMTRNINSDHVIR
jgi:hypothetical protein